MSLGCKFRRPKIHFLYGGWSSDNAVTARSLSDSWTVNHITPARPASYRRDRALHPSASPRQCHSTPLCHRDREIPTNSAISGSPLSPSHPVTARATSRLIPSLRQERHRARRYEHPALYHQCNRGNLPVPSPILYPLTHVGTTGVPNPECY